MIILIVLSVVFMGFLLYNYFDGYRKEDAPKYFAGCVVLLILFWLAFGIITPFNTIKKDITKDVQIAKGENFVVFSYKDYLLKTTNYEVVKNPEKSKIYFEVDLNLYGNEIFDDNVKPQNPMGIR